ncbi:hypothetical protein HHI36_017896, partial [Cryptolaemus montrouzieri]
MITKNNCSAKEIEVSFSLATGMRGCKSSYTRSIPNVISETASRAFEAENDGGGSNRRTPPMRTWGTLTSSTDQYSSWTGTVLHRDSCLLYIQSSSRCRGTCYLMSSHETCKRKQSTFHNAASENRRNDTNKFSSITAYVMSSEKRNSFYPLHWKLKDRIIYEYIRKNN